MSDQITKDLGGITAYAAAVAAGYTGTKAQFETLMASYATVAQNAAASATAANGSAEDAEAYAVGTRDGSDVGSTDPAYHNNSKYYAELAEDYADSIDPDTLAKIDGYYQEMTVGDAEQIVSSILVEDKAPYQFRTAGGSVDIGKRAYFDAIVGGTVGWNQLLPEINSTNWGFGNATGSISDGVAQFVASQKYGYLFPYSTALSAMVNAVSGHKYLASASIKLTTATNLVWLQIRDIDGTGTRAQAVTSQTTALQTIATVYSAPVTEIEYPRIIDTRDSGWDNITASELMVIDLTQMLGSTIADYIYSLEQATAGAGVAFFRKYFQKPYYSYNAGELVSVSGLSAHKTRGFNQWDEEWEVGSIDAIVGQNENNPDKSRSKNYIPCTPNTAYFYCCDTIWASFRFYGADKSYLGQSTAQGLNRNTVFTTPSNCYYMRFVLQNNVRPNACCINLHWDGSRDGEYEEYKEHTYPLDDSLTLRGIPKLVDGKLEYDGDEYLPDGTVNRRYGIVDLGSLTWTMVTSGHYTADVSNSMNLQNTTVANAVCSIYQVLKADSVGTINKSVAVGLNLHSMVYVHDETYTDATTFKTAMSGVYLVYELATPTTEEADAYSGIQIVDDFGTEEFITDTSVPVGHVTHYPVNLVAKLEMEPNSPDGNGDYIVQQASGINTYIPLASTDTITNIIARLEALEGGGE